SAGLLTHEVHISRGGRSSAALRQPCQASCENGNDESDQSTEQRDNARTAARRPGRCVRAPGLRLREPDGSNGKGPNILSSTLLPIKPEVGGDCSRDVRAGP